MEKPIFSEHQIIKAIWEYEAGRKVHDISLELGIEPRTFYNWRKKYSGVETSRLQEFKELRIENSRLKVMYIDQLLQIRTLRNASK